MIQCREFADSKTNEVCPCLHHEGIYGHGGIAPPIFKLGTGCG